MNILACVQCLLLHVYQEACLVHEQYEHPS